jgi:hypothetical protein
VSTPTPEQLGLVTPKDAPRDSDLYKALYKQRGRNGEKLATIMGATLLVVDPSIGSEKSQPGYALFRAGELVDYGTLEVGTDGDHHVRLRELARCLREDFSDTRVDWIIVEDIPPARVVRHAGKVYKSVKAHIPLHRAVGAVLATVCARNMLLVAPNTWHQYTDAARYAKSDATDAVAMGFTVLQMASYILSNPEKVPLKKEKRRRRRKVKAS